MDKKRVACLYRVSTKKQLDKDDIPMQKIECYNFIAQHPDWELSKEYLEKGVSGFKKNASDRDVLQKLKRDAQNGLFDILLVFMFDRLGRIENESPFVLEWFTKQGIEVWSVKEGEQKFEQHVDKLINYIRFWQSSGESEKTSIRVDAKHVQMAEEGLFHGGRVPYGYTTQESGRKNKKGKVLLEMVISEPEAEIVKKIFSLAHDKMFGSCRIASELNRQGIKPHFGSLWRAHTIRRILANPVYKGYPAYRKTSRKGCEGKLRHVDKEEWVLPKEVISSLVIINENTWNEVNDVIEARKEKKDHNSYSPLLLTGIVYCGHCGSKLYTYYGQKTYTKKDGNVTKSVSCKYRCSGKSLDLDCSGQTTYSSKKIESCVLDQISQYLKTYSEDIKNTNFNDDTRGKQLKNQHRKLCAEMRKLEENKAALSKEIAACLLGNSRFTEEMLVLSINQNKEDIEKKQKEIDRVQVEIENAREVSDNSDQILDIVQNWDKWMETLDAEQKKVLIRLIVDRIDVFVDHVDIYFKDAIQNFAMSG